MTALNNLDSISRVVERSACQRTGLERIGADDALARALYLHLHDVNIVILVMLHRRCIVSKQAE